MTGKGEFINGVRLVYPMEDEAMRFLNLLGNASSPARCLGSLSIPIKIRCVAPRFSIERTTTASPTTVSSLAISTPSAISIYCSARASQPAHVDMPVRYRARSYGETKISRFSHGWLLLKMTAFGFVKLRMGF